MKKLLSALLCLSFLLTAVACKKAPPVDEPESVYANYEDIVADYIELLTAQSNGDALQVPNTAEMDERESAIAEALYGIADFYEKKPELIQSLGYGYKDMDGNGISELFLLSGFYPSAIFTLSDGKPILLVSSWDPYTSSCTFAGNDRFFLTRDSVTDHIEEANYYTFHIEGDKLVYDLAYGAIYDQENKTVLEYFQTVDGNRITIDKETFDELNWGYERTTGTTYSDKEVRKFAAPYIHFPFKESVDTSNLPVADFSSYDAILSTCQMIFTSVEDFNYTGWLYSNAYDNLFSFPNEESFEYYNRLLFASQMNTYDDFYPIGYDLIDLNGDAQDELVLLSESYNIKAIFTQKQGVPVMLKGLSSAAHCWLDENGLIRVDFNRNDKAEFTTYALTLDGELETVFSLLVTKLGRYLTRDGKTEKIPFEESLELYDEYCVYPEYVDPNEYTRDVSSLTFTPLSESAENPLQSATQKSWSNYSNLEKTAGKEYGAYSITYMTFENVTDTQMDVNFKYKFTYYYPDPDKDHYLLDDTTETFLKVTARKENGVFVFDENGIKGYIEFGQAYQWLIIEQSTDERFPIGSHCFKKHEPIG